MRTLMDKRAQNVRQIVVAPGVLLAIVSWRLKQLAKAGLVVGRKKHLKILFRLDYAIFESICDFACEANDKELKIAGPE